MSEAEETKKSDNAAGGRDEQTLVVWVEDTHRSAGSVVWRCVTSETDIRDCGLWLQAMQRGRGGRPDPAHSVQHLSWSISYDQLDVCKSLAGGCHQGAALCSLPPRVARQRRTHQVRGWGRRRPRTGVRCFPSPPLLLFVLLSGFVSPGWRFLPASRRPDRRRRDAAAAVCPPAAAMVLTLSIMFQSALLFVNAFAVLHEQRFLNKSMSVGWGGGTGARSLLRLCLCPRRRVSCAGDAHTRGTGGLTVLPVLFALVWCLGGVRWVLFAGGDDLGSVGLSEEAVALDNGIKRQVVNLLKAVRLVMRSTFGCVLWVACSACLLLSCMHGVCFCFLGSVVGRSSLSGREPCWSVLRQGPFLPPPGTLAGTHY